MLFFALLTVTVTFVLVLIIEVDRDFIDPATAEAGSNGPAINKDGVSPWRV
jgi:hypothetical protein